MKTLFTLLLLAAACFYWFDARSNRRDLEDAKKQIQVLTLERDQAVQKLKQFSGPSRQAATTGETNWFQQRLDEKSALDSSPGKKPSPGKH